MLNYDSPETFPPEKKQKKKRPFLLTLLGLFVVFGFFFLVMLLLNGGGGLYGDHGSGTGNGGDGPGSGINGTGRGAGTTGDGITSGNGSGKGAGDHQEQGETSGKPGTEDKAPSSPKAGENSTGVQNEKANLDEFAKPSEEPPLNILTIPEEKKKHALDLKSYPQKEDDSAVPATGYSSGSGRSGLAGKKGFFGVKVTGNTIFIVDVSGSMSGKTNDQISRIDVLKWQLKNAIQTSKKSESSAKYCILAFSESPHLFFPDKKDNKIKMKSFLSGVDKQVEQFIDQLSPCGGTDLLGALRVVNDMLKKKEISVKTIFILTDGDPDSSWTTIRDFIKQEIPPKIVINTISIGMSCNDMKELAKERKGVYREIL